ncbi:MAG TPA: hypothetical protein VGA63_12095, partial [Geopsychrobacteraceae bacterium]
SAILLSCESIMICFRRKLIAIRTPCTQQRLWPSVVNVQRSAMIRRQKQEIGCDGWFAHCRPGAIRVLRVLTIQAAYQAGPRRAQRQADDKASWICY